MSTHTYTHPHAPTHTSGCPTYSNCPYTVPIVEKPSIVDAIMRVNEHTHTHTHVRAHTHTHAHTPRDAQRSRTGCTCAPSAGPAPGTPSPHGLAACRRTGWRPRPLGSRHPGPVVSVHAVWVLAPAHTPLEHTHTHTHAALEACVQLFVRLSTCCAPVRYRAGGGAQGSARAGGGAGWPPGTRAAQSAPSRPLGRSGRSTFRLEIFRLEI